MTTPLGNKIRALRKDKGYTLDRLAELADSSKSYIWELENKEPPRPSGDKISKIATALGVTTDYFLTDDVELEDAADQAFYREYRAQRPKTKARLRQMFAVIKDDEQ
ncbi:helix-turn-helix domain-containing protein [Mesorhizobium sp. M1066]|uniref:Helix-turn-helix domain-containing protein n=1 Tax=Mesorhizobium opportunistum TaxID=593909 RepID=A0ABV1YB22_9HYPH|nr:MULTISPECIES: helix-turn-helix transcriptional regulator [unclassified Mesorhizobium]ESX29360.1 XRE family transcriptional regulator [Mesorhizobium sp. LSHC440B00]ESX43170.1 XRE family transcriptional regulator [Mesorhizobium sp. LSHC440A00]ESY31511.1 XRE family transcriptional regulator [Mesorhizobium sp. LNJC391B00]ESZ30478.1 XRE family transcriptional regulator [Mesorhizobium sp. L2C084A000]